MPRPSVVLAGALFLLLGCARTVEFSGGDCIITDPPATAVWIWADGAERVVGEVALARYYPERALRRRVEGEVTLKCNGGSCTAINESPVDDGFGLAAERAARDAGLLPATGVITIKVAFRVTGPGRGRQWACGQTPPP